MRVYEFGPEDGHKVLFIHGISTSCVTLGRLANGLVDRGCRVMLFVRPSPIFSPEYPHHVELTCSQDLFGRGFSDGVADLPHDTRLYISQILLALASSPLPWTGSAARVRVVGYSLGGGIAVHLANTLPHLVSSLVLLAPAGLIRPETFGAVSRFVFSSGVVPERLVSVLTKRRLRQPIASSSRQRRAPAASPDVVEATAAVAAEASDPPAGETASPLERRVLLYVQWMAEHHAGFVPAFMSCIRHAPLTGQHESWTKLADRRAGSTVVMLAEADEIIDVEEYTREALPLVGGEDRVVWRVLSGGHDFVMTHAEDILRVLYGVWSVKA
jgi:pimeloyl-ACP methyl ester carboxylesterase